MYRISLIFIAMIFVFAACNSEKSETIVVPAQNTINNETANQSFDIDMEIAVGSDYYQKGDFYSAISSFTKVYEVDSTNLIAITSLGNLYFDINQNDKAIEFYKKVLQITPNNINVRSDMATSYFRLNQPEIAIEIHKESIKLDYNHLMSHYNLAVVLNSIGRTEEAEAERRIFNDLKLQQQQAN